MEDLSSANEVLTALTHCGCFSCHPETGKIRIPDKEIRKEFLETLRNGSQRETATWPGPMTFRRCRERSHRSRESRRCSGKQAGAALAGGMPERVKMMMEDARQDTWNPGTAILEAAFREMQKSGVSDGTPVIPTVSPERLQAAKNRCRRIRAYINQHWNIMTSRPVGTDASSEFLLMLLNPEGCVVMTRGDEGLREEAAKAGIQDGSVWSMETTGPNAISLGLRFDRAFSTGGEQNYLQILKPYLLCYAPLKIDRTLQQARIGGLALITRQDEQYRKLHTLFLASFAGSLLTHYESAGLISRGYQSVKEGVAWIDFNTRSGECTLAHHNDAFFDALEIPRIPEEEAYYMPMKKFIDPLPFNRIFWDILSNMEEVSEKEVQLVTGGRRRSFVISTTADEDRTLHTKSILLRIDTRSRRAKEISRKTANSAVMGFETVIGESGSMQETIRKAQALARTQSNVLLCGESGVGKDVFAQAIHNAGDRRDKPFIAVNCGAIPRELIASELFGYEGGAFTGAKKQGNIGKFELADGGTLFLDEIGELPMDLQATLLRAVEQKSFMRIGSNKVVNVDVRIISATNADIPRMIEEKRFRMDLYYRLGTMSLQIPPLRERGRDPVLLAQHFIHSICARCRIRPEKSMTSEAEDLLCKLPWYGNVRELQNLMECLVQLYPDTIITAQQVLESLNPVSAREAIADIRSFISERQEDMPDDGQQAMGGRDSASGHDRTFAGYHNSFREEAASERDKMGDNNTISPSNPYSVPETRRLLTREEILAALHACDGNRSRAARYLGIARKTLYRNMERLGL